MIAFGAQLVGQSLPVEFGECGRIGHLRCHRREDGWIRALEELVEELCDLGLERGDSLLNALDLELDCGVVLLEFLIEEFAAPRDSLFGLLANPLDSCLRALPDRGQVFLGRLSQPLGSVLRSGVELLHVTLCVGLSLIEDSLLRRLRGRTHGLR